MLTYEAASWIYWWRKRDYFMIPVGRTCTDYQNHYSLCSQWLFICPTPYESKLSTGLNK